MLFSRLHDSIYLHVIFSAVEVRPQCYSDNDCARNEICHDGNCVDACRVKNCGTNAKCETGFHSAKCICLPGYTGNAEVACNLFGLPTEPTLDVGCDSNADCPDYTACENRQCINPCAIRDPCAPSAICKVVRHEPVCTCPDGYIGNPQTSCELPPRPECTTDPECPEHLACIREKCQDPCQTHSCGVNAECKVKRHRAFCVCIFGYEGDPYTICEERKHVEC
jgi:hypothetical protein